MAAGRYVILLMAIFSIYTGLLYNEAFSIPMSVFGPGHWACPTNLTLSSRPAMTLDPSLCPKAFDEGLARTTNTPYAVGVDPTWHGTRSELQYLNSVKMKLSIVLGAPSLTNALLLRATCLSSRCPCMHMAANERHMGFGTEQVEKTSMFAPSMIHSHVHLQIGLLYCC